LINRFIIGLNFHFRRILVIVLITGFSFSGFSQGEFNTWYFGQYAGISFNSGVPVALQNNPMEQHGSFVGITVSDSLGHILFYSNGYKVWNRNHVVMPNGTGLTGGETTCQSIAVQDISNPDLYYMFFVDHRQWVFQPFVGLQYSVLNMQLDGGLGDIVPGMKNIPLPMGDSVVVQITATRHKNNRDAWVVALRASKEETYLAYLIDASGLHTTPVISQSTLKNNFPSSSSTGLKSFTRISPDGKYLFCTDSLTEMCLFNTATGKVTPQFRFWPGPGQKAAESQEFSIDSRYVYFTTPSGPPAAPFRAVMQYDLTNDDSSSFMQSQVVVGDSCGWNIQMAPDGKIYLVDLWNNDSLHVVRNPSAGGSACNFQRHAFSLEGNNHYFCLPQFLQRYKAYIHSNGQCQNDSIHFSGDIWPPPDSIHWDFGDPGSGAANFSNDTTPFHIYNTPGNYTVTLFVRHIDHRTDTSWRTITILPAPQPALGPDRSFCIGDSVTLDAGFCAGCTYQWDNIAAGQINLGNGQTLTVYDSGMYVVHVTNTSGCTGRDTVQVSVSPPPLLTTTPLFKSICSGDSTFIPLSSNVPAATFSWTASLTSGNISGFSADSGMIINQILTNNISSPGIVTYHIAPKVGNCIGDTSDYAVTVDPRDTASVSITSTATMICTGTSVTFTATPVNGGTTPTYQWQVNGINVGTNSSVFTYLPMTNDQVQIILTSSEICTANNPDTSNVITMTVNPNLPVSVSVSPSANPFCIGTPVTFTATPVNGGVSPTYQWQVNGVNVGTNSPVFTYLPMTNDKVQIILTSSEICTTNNPDTSAAITMTGFPGLPADVTIMASPSPSCQGVPVTFTATPINGGSNPSYQWQVNGMNVGTNSPIYTYIPAPLDLVSCIMTSNLVCVTNNPVSSLQFPVSISPTPVVTFTPCFDTITATNAKPIRLKGGIPLGGTYTGPGVSANIFNPATAGPGMKIITYTYTNASLCSASATARIFNFPFSIFNCGSNLIDIRDGKVYPTIQIGGQCWFATDLDYGYEILPSIHQRDNCISENYKPTVGSPPSTVYQWDELMRYDPTPGQQGLCPPGWHVPTETEWATLFTNWTNNAFAAAPLKYSGYSGFNALLTGIIPQNTISQFHNFAIFFWSSTAYGPYKAWAHGMNDPDYSVSYYPSLRSNAFSVRCLRD
jgi:uncharacterized protein (TIGR02145 family)